MIVKKSKHAKKGIQFFVLLLSLLLGLELQAQELQCKVQVLTPQIQRTNKQIYDNMQQTIEQFMNTQQWTSDKFLPHERIECNILITIDEEKLDQFEFSGSMQVSATRPVYGSSINAAMLNQLDKDVSFKFTEFQRIEYVEGTYTDNLSAILSFYAYMIIGMDYDSYSYQSGGQFFQKALAIANSAESGGRSGWSSAGIGDQNRYWFVQQILDERFNRLRKTLYDYHRRGMDQFSKDFNASRKIVLESLERLRNVHQDQPNSWLVQIFLNSKRLEIINIFSKAGTEEKNRIITLMEIIDVSKLSLYREKLFS